jgi:hypothetical protein
MAASLSLRASGRLAFSISVNGRFFGLAVTSLSVMGFSVTSMGQSLDYLHKKSLRP